MSGQSNTALAKLADSTSLTLVRPCKTPLILCLAMLWITHVACRKLMIKVQFLVPSLNTRLFAFLAVQNSSIGDLVPCLLAWSDTTNNQSLHNTTE